MFSPVVSTRIRAGHVARMGERKNAYQILVAKNDKKRDHFGDLCLGVNVRRILN
jgi:hypothetical protein